jgi:hypothetical protein
MENGKERKNKSKVIKSEIRNYKREALEQRTERKSREQETSIKNRR